MGSAGKPPDLGVTCMTGVEAALGTMIGAATPAEGYRELVSRRGRG